MAAVDVLGAAIGVEADDGHGGILADVFFADVAIDGGRHGVEGLAGEQLRVHHALHGGGEDGGGDALAGDVGDGDGEEFVVCDGEEEVAADFAAGDGAGGDFGEGDGWEFGRHDVALDGGGDVEFFAVEAVVFLGEGELGVVDERGGIGGDGAQEVAVDVREGAGADAAVEVEESEDLGFAIGTGAAVASEGNADDTANVVGDDALGGLAGAEGIGNDEFACGFEGFADGAVGDGCVVGDGGAFAAAGHGELEFAGGGAEEDEAAFDLSEFEGGFKEGGEDLVHAAFAG